MQSGKKSNENSDILNLRQRSRMNFTKGYLSLERYSKGFKTFELKNKKKA